ncbi:glycosyltransferase [Brevibacillus thermoruber]|uniref:Glycosyltransferase n=1 Tax=Brevibacillus thermoruber TaxID=33942 RepID=A0A9X3TUV8_9BACL|nr:glycosyltransferase [Brevibacillus thermoruber]MDA5110865.1 glycosyltransferase [Brevibacillus thermoruber]
MSDETLPLVSVVIPAKNEGDNVRTTIESSLNAKTRYPYEIIVVDDGSTDNCCNLIAPHVDGEKIKLIATPGIGAAPARNLGAEHANGTYLIFCDAHLTFEDYWIDGLIELMRSGLADAVSPGIASSTQPSLVGYGQTLNAKLGIKWNHHQNRPTPCAILPGGCLAVKRDVFSDIGGFDRGFRVWGFEDIEISIKMWLFGYKCYVQPAVKVLHLFRHVHPYEVTYDHVYYNMLRMAYSHFNESRIKACKNLIVHGDRAQIERQVLEGGAVEQRLRYFGRRKYDDNWFMKWFKIPF